MDALSTWWIFLRLSLERLLTWLIDLLKSVIDLRDLLFLMSALHGLLEQWKVVGLPRWQMLAFHSNLHLASIFAVWLALESHQALHATHLMLLVRVLFALGQPAAPGGESLRCEGWVIFIFLCLHRFFAAAVIARRCLLFLLILTLLLMPSWILLWFA